MSEEYAKHLARIAPPPPEKRVWSTKAHVRLAIVMPEPRPHRFMRPVLHAAAHVYGGDPDVALCILHGTGNEGFVRDVVGGWEGVRCVNLGVANLSIPDYNERLTSAAFYRDLHADFVLILQTDALLRKRVPEAFFAFDYVGGPWHHMPCGGGTNARNRVGNGGFSLRRCEAMASICERGGGGRHRSEDVFFAERVDMTRMPTVEEASAFAVEHIRHPDPVGHHQAYVFHDAAYVAGLVATTPGYVGESQEASSSTATDPGAPTA